MQLWTEKYNGYILKQGGPEQTNAGKLKNCGYLIIYQGSRVVNRIKYTQGSSGFFFNRAVRKAKARIDAKKIEKYTMYKHKAYGPNGTKNCSGVISQKQTLLA